MVDNFSENLSVFMVSDLGVGLLICILIMSAFKSDDLIDAVVCSIMGWIILSTVFVIAESMVNGGAVC